MHLPFIQVANDLIRHAADLAIELDIDEATAGWGLVKLIQWALSRCPDDAPPSANAVITGPAAVKLIARAAGYTGDPERFVDACCRLQPKPILERVTGGIRIRGLDRYDEAWRVTQSRTEKARAAAQARWSKDARSNAQALPEQCSSDAPAMPGGCLDQCPADAPACPDPYAYTDTDLKACAGGPPAPPAHEVLQAAWNELTAEPIPRWKDTGKARRKAAEAALKRRPLAEWREVFRLIGQSPFCRGETGGWRADPDWALRAEGRKPEPAAKVLEGAYAGEAARHAKGPPRHVGAHESPDAACAVCGDPAYTITWGNHALCLKCTGRWQQVQLPTGTDDLSEFTRDWVARQREVAA